MTIAQVDDARALTAGIVVSDIAFVEALRTWYHEIVWKSPGVSVDYVRAEETFAELGGVLPRDDEPEAD